LLQCIGPGKWRIGTLTYPRRLAMLRQGLRELGYVEGANLVIDARPVDKVDQLAAFAAELVALKPDVIVPFGTQAVQAVQQATNSIGGTHNTGDTASLLPCWSSCSA
jgi:hypothetical protein